MNFGKIMLNQNIKTMENYAIKDTDNFNIYIKAEDFYKDIANGVEKLFDPSSYYEDDNRPLPRGINKKLIGLFKDELRKVYSSEHKKAKGTKNVSQNEGLNLIIIEIADLRTKQYQNHNKDLKVRHIVYILKNSIRLH